ncbi:MAG: MBOAT family O-acyltransferase [Myxococcota bacterium]
MSFVQVEFVAFFAIVFGAYWALSAWGSPERGRRGQNLLLVVASAVFYGWVHPWFCGLLLASALLDYTAARVMTARPGWRDVALIASIGGNLIVLGYFKYFNFFVANVATVFEATGVGADLRLLKILLPVGISFYTFQTLSYTIDVYRGQLKARTRLLDVLVFVGFFPQLVAGPIERAADLLPQVERPRSFQLDRVLEGLTLALWGAVQKLCIADTLAPYIDKVFLLADPPGPLLWAAALGFTVQLYADFAGYTDIARGTARMLGFELSVNFRSPYLAATTPEFWQRWHITLSRWIRDYVLVPLVSTAPRVTVPHLIGAVTLTFMLVGLWHGARWNFVLFGLFHALAITIYTLLDRAVPDARRWRWARPFAIVVHFVVVGVVGAMIFRETRIDRIVHHLQTPPWVGSPDDFVAAAVILGMTTAVSVPFIASHFVVRYLVPELRGSPWAAPVQTTAWAVFAVALFVFYRVGGTDFIYFQF